MGRPGQDTRTSVLQATGKDKDNGQDGKAGQWAGRQGRSMGRTARQDNGQDGKAGHGQDGQGRTRAGQTGMVHAQDGRGIKWAGQQKAGCQLILVKSRAGHPDNKWHSAA